MARLLICCSDTLGMPVPCQHDDLDRVDTARDLDALLLRRVPLLRDELLAYAVERSRAEAAAILFGAVDDETFDRVMSALGGGDDDD